MIDTVDFSMLVVGSGSVVVITTTQVTFNQVFYNIQILKFLPTPARADTSRTRMRKYFKAR